MSAAQVAQFLVAGEEAQVSVGLNLECTGSFPSVDQVASEVRDESNVAVAHVLSGLTTSFPPLSGHEPKFGTVRATVRFTPNHAGAFFVKATFEPSVGLAQYKIQSVERRQDAGFRVLATSRGPCAGFDVTSRGSVLCFSGSTPFHVRASPYGQEILYSAFGGVAVFADVLWVFGAAGLERYVDTGTALTLTGTAGLPFSDVRMAADEEGVWIAGDAPPWLARARPLSDGGIGLMFEPRAKHQFSGIVGSKDEVVLSDITSVVALREDGGEESFGAPGAPLAFDGRTLWRRQGQLLVGLVGSANGILGASIALPASERRDVLFTPAPGFAPLLYFPNPESEGRAVPTVGDAGISLDVFDPGPGFDPISSATHRHAFARSQDGSSVKVFDLAPTHQ